MTKALAKFSFILLGLAVFTSCAHSPKNAGDRQSGLASWYGKDHHGKKTASGEAFNMNALTAAHRKLPLGSVVRVTSLTSSKSVEVRINDRGPFSGGRIIDLSYEAARRLGMIAKGTDEVEIQVVSTPASH